MYQKDTQKERCVKEEKKKRTGIKDVGHHPNRVP
jgi:hypothetical protein